MLSIATRLKAFEAGLYQSHTGGPLVELRSLHDAHLINALLKALAVGEHQLIRDALTREVVRRGLLAATYREALRREP